MSRRVLDDVLVEEWQWLIDGGVHPERAAQHLGVDLRAIQKRLWREQVAS